MPFARIPSILFAATVLLASLPLPTLAQEVAAPVEIEAPATDAAGSTEINVKNADIAAIVRLFSRKTKRNYILDENVKGKVSIYLPGKVSSDEALKILESTLAMKGFSSVPIGENLWKIVPAKDAKQSTIPTLMDDTSNPTAAMVTRIVNLKYTSADDIKQLITPLIAPEGLITAYTGTNSLMLIDSESNIQRIVNIINSLDVPSSDRDMTIIPVVNADAKDIADKLNEILGSGSAQATSGSDNNLDLLRERIRQSAMRIANRPSGSNAANAGGAEPVSSTTVAARAKEPKIIADERTNSLIVIADEDTTARIKALVSQLDSKVDLSGNKFYVYRCQHATATELAEVLSGVAGGGGSSSTRSSLGQDGTGGNQSGLSSAFGGSRLGTNRTNSRLQNSSRNLGESRNTNASRGTTGVVNLSENLSITADPATNSLIIIGSKADYQKLLELLKELDVKRRQVLVEAMLLEVAVDDNQSMGIDWVTSGGGADGGFLAGNNAGDLVSVLRDPQQLSGFSVAAASAGSLRLPGFSIPTQSVLLSAAQANSNVNVLSAPTILATDNESAEIVVGQNVPFVASQATSETNLNNTFNQIDRQDVGITLRLTPQISSGDSVTLKIFTEVSNVIESTLSSNLGPTTTIRTSETTAITKDGQMVVIGGLMSDNVSDTESGVPFFKDIPVLGHLFRDARSDRRRTNLLIFITPRVVQDQYDARDVTIEKRDVMEREITIGETYPQRKEVLENPAIDRVAESSRFEGTQPGTITGSSKVAPDALSSSSAALSSNGTLKLKASPRLPNAASAAPAAALTAGGRDNFIVFQLAGPRAKTGKLPFALSDDGVFGVVVPAEANGDAHRFFGVGQTYSYQLEDQQLPIQAVGTFASSDEAKQVFPALTGNWYTLSPYEIMNLGSGPWAKATAAKTR